jgi:hypothetical protein
MFLQNTSEAAVVAFLGVRGEVWNKASGLGRAVRSWISSVATASSVQAELGWNLSHEIVSILVSTPRRSAARSIIFTLNIIMSHNYLFSYVPWK